MVVLIMGAAVKTRNSHMLHIPTGERVEGFGKARVVFADDGFMKSTPSAGLKLQIGIEAIYMKFFWFEIIERAFMSFVPIGRT